MTKKLRSLIATYIHRFADVISVRPAVELCRRNRGRGYREGIEDGLMITRGEDLKLIAGHRSIVWEHERDLNAPDDNPEDKLRVQFSMERV